MINNNALVGEFYNKLKGKNNLSFVNDTFLVNIRSNDILPVSDATIRFSDDIWEIHTINQINLAKTKGKINFEYIHYEYRDIVKGVIYKYLVIDELAANTIEGKFRLIKGFVNYLTSLRIFNVKTITLRDILKFFDEMEEMSAHHRQAYKTTIIDLLQFIEVNNLVDSNQYIDIYKYFNKNKATLELKIEKENGKTPEVPIDFFNKLVSCASSILENSSARFQEKQEACVIIFLSQIGLRVGEVKLLQKNSMYSIYIFNESEKVYYLNYVSPKAKKKKAKTFMTNLAKKAYDYMNTNSNQASKYLFTNNNGTMCTENQLRHLVLLFCVRNYKYLGCLNRVIDKSEGLCVLKYKDLKKPSVYVCDDLLGEFKKEDYLVYPSPHQFRVSVCNWLIRSGKSIDWIREHMNHLDYETTLHYSRRQEKDKKEKEIAATLLKEVIKKDVKLIGKDSGILVTKIDEFIKNNKYNVSTDLDEIVKKLQGKIPIRQKESGYCIKSSFGRKCTHDGYSQDIYCAFGVCPNHFTTYKMVDISYKAFNDLKRTIKYNIENKFLSQANMELNKLKRVINEALEPEFEELKNEIDKMGVEHIASNNPNLKEIVQNYDIILKEVNKWKDIKLEQI